MPASETIIPENRDGSKAAAQSYRLVILNEFDAPETRMIAVVRETEDGPEWTYLSDEQRVKSAKYLRWNPLTRPDVATDLSTFGVKPIIELRDGKHMIRVEQVSPSRATYSDGVSRKWQGFIGGYSTVRSIFTATAAARTALTKAAGQ